MPTSWLTLRTFVSVLGALALGSVAAAQNPSSVWTIPGTVNAGGLNNTRFVSDLAVTNPGGVPARITIALVPANGTAPSPVTLAAGATVVYRNVLDRVWGVQGAGATQVTSDVPILIRARTYNTAASGTYGVALPVLADDRLLVPGLTAHSLWVSQSADGSSGYRTNIAVAFPDAGGGAATVTVYDAGGNEAGSQDYALDAAGFQQFGVGSFAGGVAVARAEVQVTRGRAAGYSVVVDNVTGDSSLFSFEELPSGYQDVVVNGVARANGRNGTFFRTDGRFFNPTDEDATVKASFHASGPSNPAPVSRTFTVGAGRILDVVDVLDTLLGLPVGSAGAVRFETDASVGILCRTSNVDPFGVVPGTFGAQQRPNPLLSFLMSADAGAVITGIRQGAAFRTNVGFAAGADGADYTLTLKSSSGATVATATGSLGAFGWTQPNVQDLFPNATIPDDATLQVKVTTGSVDVFDSSIDNASGDPVVTPIMPLPVAIQSFATIGPAGGSVRSDDGRMTLKIPAGALVAPVAVSLAPQAVADAEALGSAYALTPPSLSPSKPLLLVFRPASGAPGSNLASVTLGVRTPAGTFAAVGGRIDPAAGTLSVPIVSTNPSAAASRAAVASQRSLDEAPTLIVPLSAMALVPAEPFVLTDGSVDLQVILKWPPSAGIRPPGFRLSLSLDDLLTVTRRWLRPRIGSIVVQGQSARYTAPHRIGGPAARAEFRVAFRRDGVEQFFVPINVVIVRRDWRIETEVRLQQPCLAFYTLDMFWNEQGSFRIADPDAEGKFRITKNFAATAQTGTPKWGICDAIPHGFTTITPNQNQTEVDVKFQTIGDTEIAFFDPETGTIEILGSSEFSAGGAVLTGPSVSPLPVGDQAFSASWSLSIRPFQEGTWVDAYPPILALTTHRHRIISIDTP
ncbi:MAG: hypothetical protein IPL89_08475 [Acidobacteria bacterium]|nr:hypothetical protein [Acidobacteriota bacterium]